MKEEIEMEKENNRQKKKRGILRSETWTVTLKLKRLPLISLHEEDKVNRSEVVKVTRMLKDEMYIIFSNKFASMMTVNISDLY